MSAKERDILVIILSFATAFGGCLFAVLIKTFGFEKCFKQDLLIYAAFIGCVEKLDGKKYLINIRKMFAVLVITFTVWVAFIGTAVGHLPSAEVLLFSAISASFASCAFLMPACFYNDGVKKELWLQEIIFDLGKILRCVKEVEQVKEKACE